MNTNTLKIERIEKPTLEFFQKHIFAQRKPVIITGAMDNWKACSLWTDDYLNAAVGNHEVVIHVSQDGSFMGDAKDKDYKSVKEIKFSDFIHLLKLNRNVKETYCYLPQASIPKLLPKLIQDIELPVYCEKTLWDDSLINLWLGSGGNTTLLHFDRADNLLAQVRGRKRFILFAPQQTAFLYPFPFNCPTPHFSQINIDKPDLTKFPKFTKAKSFEVILEAGEMIFIPAFWWHQVYSLEGDRLPIISVNFWCKFPMLQWLTPPGRRYAQVIPNKFRTWGKRLTRKITTKLQLIRFL